jgi:hypothetical protein
MTGEHYILTTHAVERFIERVRPGLALPGAELELERVLAHGHLTDQPPVWLADRRRPDASMYVSLGDVSLPLARSRERVGQWVALTCLTTGTVSPAARARRKQMYQARRRSRRAAAGRSRAAGRTRRREMASGIEDELVTRADNGNQTEV